MQVLIPLVMLAKIVIYLKNCSIVPAVVCIKGLIATFRVAVVSHGISFPNAEKYPGFPPS